MGSASSNAEALERRRIEREVRLGLYRGPTNGLNPMNMGMRPVNPYQHLGLPPPRPIGAVGYRSPSPPRAGRQFQQRGGSNGYPAVAQSAEFPPRRSSPLRSNYYQDVRAEPPSYIDARSDTPPKGNISPQKNHTSLRWVAPESQKKSDDSLLGFLAFAKRSSPSRRGTTNQRRGETPRRRDYSPTYQRFAIQRSPTPPRRKKVMEVKPTMQRALYMLELEEVEDRAYVVTEELNMFDHILASFSYAVELEAIRVAAFQLFELERKVRKTVGAQEHRERKIISFWRNESYEDAALNMRVRVMQAGQSQRRMSSRSPWRAARSSSKDYLIRVGQASHTGRGSTLLSDQHLSPSPIPPDGGRHGRRSPSQSMKFAFPSSHVGVNKELEKVPNHHKDKSQLGARHPASTRNESRLLHYSQSVEDVLQPISLTAKDATKPMRDDTGIRPYAVEEPPRINESPARNSLRSNLNHRRKAHTLDGKEDTDEELEIAYSKKKNHSELQEPPGRSGGEAQHFGPSVSSEDGVLSNNHLAPSFHSQTSHRPSGGARRVEEDLSPITPCEAWGDTSRPSTPSASLRSEGGSHAELLSSAHVDSVHQSFEDQNGTGQRSSSGGHRAPCRRPPPPPPPPYPTVEYHRLSGEERAFYAARNDSAAAVNSRFAALLNASE